MKKILSIIVSIIIILIIAVVIFLGYLGFIPGLSKLFGSDKPRDLGVTWDVDDYVAAHKLTGVEVKTATGQVPDKETIVSYGSHPAKLNLSDVAITAIINNNSGNWKYFPVSNVQVKIASDGSAQMSGLLHFDRLAGYAAATGANYENIKIVMDTFKLLPSQLPFYIAGTASAEENSANLNLSKVEIGRAPVPSDYLIDYKSQINGFFTQQLKAFPGFSVKAASMSDGKIYFNGTLADSITTYK
jgi:hypothetical protein